MMEVHPMFDAVTLARAVDERVCCLPPGCDPARLFGVRLKPENFVLIPFWSGVAREIPEWVSPPPGVAAIALDTTGWAAPLAEDGEVGVTPSRHPERQRIHQTVLVHGAGRNLSVLRYLDDLDQPVVVLEQAVGAVPELLARCWDRRAA
jgi:hypothetical protein